MEKEYTSHYLAELVGGVCNSTTNKSQKFNNFASLKNASADSVSFFLDYRYLSSLKNSNAGIILLKEKDKGLWNGLSIFVDDPYLAFAKISNLFIKNNNSNRFDAKSFKSCDHNFLNSVKIHPSAVLGTDIRISENVEIGSFVSIGSNVTIGKNTIIYPNVVICDGSSIGDNCIIFPGAVIGSDGFGYAKDTDNSWLKIPQIGSVKIENNVEIGANTTIDRGTLDDTIICSGVKIDNLVQIAHNCIIGENSVIAGCVGIAGSTSIGKNCIIGGAAMIVGHINIADYTVISGGTLISKSILDKGKRFTSVIPFFEHKTWLKFASNLKKLIKE
jgi:UDP-3-O-[3-hydroxymyristoyl] glucosamine N-acyltransferase